MNSVHKGHAQQHSRIRLARATFKINDTFRPETLHKIKNE